ncbi:hypothetical protein AVEN_29583-1 [Araneus ventricosus]|uniref:Uncharacterized protein n=1 Tax=Araneus ventricosus TaxID=182803 RepID=A0A4Y2T6N0_ARAVE|nr:hypothetical protein AVEN_29583-1 [Araneus ventricosus]
MTGRPVQQMVGAGGVLLNSTTGAKFCSWIAMGNVRLLRQGMTSVIPQATTPYSPPWGLCSRGLGKTQLQLAVLTSCV